MKINKTALFTLLIAALTFIFSASVLAGNHRWSKWAIDKQPTCTKAGEKNRTCNVESIPHQEFRNIPPLGHDYEVAVKQPACTKAGVKIFTCRRCADKYTKTFGEPLGHSYKGKITTQPEYGKKGVKTFTCRRCGDTYTKSIPGVTKHRHQYEIKSEVKADCEHSGHIVYVCALCGDRYTENCPATGHNYSKWVVDRKPGLFTAGHRRAVCKNNSVHFIGENISQLVTVELNAADAVMGPVNVGLLLFLVLTLLSNLYVILWDLRMRRKTGKAGRMKFHYVVTACVLLILIIGLPMLFKLFIFNITYMNLLEITVLSAIIPTGLFLCLYARRRVKALNGNGGVCHMPGRRPETKKGRLVSRNRPC